MFILVFLLEKLLKVCPKSKVLVMSSAGVQVLI